MNKNIKKWLKALRSGKYKQTQSQLKNENSFCCLGVACDLYAKETGKGKWDGNRFIDSYNQHHEEVLPIEVQEWLEINNEDGEFKTSRNRTRALTHYNDDFGYSFKKIANIIEQCWPKLKG